MIPLDTPFVLLDDARASGAAPARLYRAPGEAIVARTADEVRPALARLRGRGARHAAGFLTYEAGLALAARPLPTAMAAGPLLWFGLFDAVEEIAPAALAARLPDPAGAWHGEPAPGIGRAAYDAQIARVRALIEAGDVYQANLTHPITLPVAGDPWSLYARLRGRARGGWSAVVNTGDRLILSFSPELFFALTGRRLTCRPMKGTARRGATPAEDAALAQALGDDPKQRAENLMIVDLMRNDLSRVARDVAVPARFAVETYPTVHQLTSTVTATLGAGRDVVDVMEALFPCGSITGAPKQRAMEVIAEVETGPRGIYTGAIGAIAPTGDAQFSVAIRTLSMVPGAGEAIGGVGGGIVADSTAAAEWDEARAKAAFLAPNRAFDLIETMAFDPLAGIALLERHLARLTASAAAFGFAFDRHDTRNELQAATFRLRRAARVRLALAASGDIAIEVAPLPAPIERLTVAIVPLPVAPADLRLRHKTSDRAFYDRARVASGADEVVFVDPHGFLTEGSFTSLFVERDGTLLTPPLARGLLPGVLRAELIATGRAIERDLTADDLRGGFLLGNALRGLIPAIVNAGAPRL